MWHYTSINNDTRVALDPKPNQIRTITKPNTIPQLGIDYLYTFNSQRRSHTLRLLGPFQYFNFSETDRGHPLFRLPLKYPSKAIPTDELVDNLHSWMRSVHLLHARSEDNSLRYNWMLGVYARSTNYTTPVGQLVVKTPAILNYSNPQDAFNSVFVALGIDYIDIPITNSNIFDDGATPYNVRIWYAPTMTEVNHILTLMRKSTLVSTHSSWHWNVLHTFHYRSESDMIDHFAAKILEDWRQKEKFDKGALVEADRVIQRLIPLSSSTYVQRLAAIGALYPNEFTENVLDLSRLSTALLQLSDTYYQHANDQLKRLYRRMYNDSRTLYMTPRHQELLLAQITANSNILLYPYTYIFTTAHITANYISNTGQGRIKHSLAVTGITQHSTVPDIVLGPTSEDVITISMVEPMSIAAEDMYGYVIDTPTRDIWPADEQVEQKGDAVALYDTKTSRALGMFNNTIRIDDLLSPLLGQVYRTYAKGDTMAMTQGSLDHLTLCAAVDSDITFVGNRMITPLAEGYTPRAMHRNNSTMKMLSLYVALKKLENFAVNSYLMSPDTSIILLGAEREPAVNILRRFNSSVSNVRIIGMGDRAVEPNIRVRVPFPIDKNISADFIICDINSYEDQSFESMFSETLSVVTTCASAATRALVKINHPSEYMINSIIERLSQLGGVFYHTALLKTASQNPYSYETYIYITPIAAAVGFPFYNNSAVINRYMTAVADDDAPVIPSIHTVIKEHSNTYSPGLFCGCVDVQSAPLALSQLKSYCSEATTWRVDSDDNLVNIIARIDPARIALEFRTRSNTSAYHEYQRCVPNGLGFKVRKTREFRYMHREVTFIHKLMLYALIRDQISLTENMTQVVSIGGRNLADVSVVPLTMKYVVIDPAARIETLTQETKNIEIQSRTFQFDASSMDLENDSIYLFIAVIMNEPNGAATPAETQMDKIRNVATAMLTRTNCVAYISFYESGIITRLGQSTAHKTIRVEDGRLKVANYVPVDTLAEADVALMLRDIGITHEIIRPSTPELVSACSSYGIRLGSTGGAVLDVFNHYSPVIKLVRS
ncbi:VP3 [Dendrolimus punctatus cypovirus 1]|nr:VP3 [Dendrolimus punctatus cypovirus 1]